MIARKLPPPPPRLILCIFPAPVIAWTLAQLGQSSVLPAIVALWAAMAIATVAGIAFVIVATWWVFSNSALPPWRPFWGMKK